MEGKEENQRDHLGAYSDIVVWLALGRQEGGKKWSNYKQILKVDAKRTC